MPQNQGFILDITEVVEEFKKIISIRLQYTSQKLESRMKMNISNNFHLFLCKIILNFSICYFVNKQLKPAYSKNSLKIKNQNNTKINVTSQKF